MFDQFKTEWLGHRIDWDHVYQYQCVDLILQYIAECYGLKSGVRGNAIDYWTQPSPPLLEKFNRIGGSDAAKGDIVIFNGLAGNPYGHIGIATGAINATQIEILEQNGQTGNGSGVGGDVIRTRFVNRNRVAGLLKPVEAAAPPPAPAAPVQKYQVVENYPTGKQIKLNKNANLWGMNYDFDFMVNHPVESHEAGEIWTVTNKVHHNNGYDYYRRDGQIDGFNVLDCDDYTPPPAPAAPLPTGALNADSPVYGPIVKNIPGYMSATNASNHTNPVTTVAPGANYFLFTSKYGMDNVTLISGSPGAWINPSDNVVDPPVVPPAPPAPVISDWHTPVTPPAPAPVAEPEALVFHQYPDGTVKYIAMKENLALIDLNGNRKSQPWAKGSTVLISGYATKNDVTYAIPEFFSSRNLLLGLPFKNPVTGLTNIEPYDDVFNSDTTIEERKVLGTAKYKDHFVFATNKLLQIERELTKVWDIIHPKKKQK